LHPPDIAIAVLPEEAADVRRLRVAIVRNEERHEARGNKVERWVEEKSAVEKSRTRRGTGEFPA